ncbi:hypothetical protein [Bifidobacterium thermophilum]|uniref:hypothetical protein n=1 Tax=Bifidobacterium TaxID=1678 RepID=UPI001177FECE|nr:hypothetical protein [Bifidobacterium thermophilum]
MQERAWTGLALQAMIDRENELQARLLFGDTPSPDTPRQDGRLCGRAIAVNNGYHPRRAIKWNIGDILYFALSGAYCRYRKVPFSAVEGDCHGHQNRNGEKRPQTR